MGLSTYRRFVSAAVVACATAWAACDERARGGDLPPDPPLERRDAAPSERPSPASSSLLPPPVGGDEGAATPEAVFKRAQASLEARDYPGLVRTIRPETRRRWTIDLALALALDSIDDGTEPDLGRRAAQASARRLLERFGATAKVDKRGTISRPAIEKQLAENVRDPDALLAAMLLFAEAHGCPLDPLCALAPTGLDGVARPEEVRCERAPTSDPAGLPSRPPSVAANGIVRLVLRVRAPHTLGKVEEAEGVPVGMTEAPAFMPIRFYRVGSVVWLDES